MILAKMTDDKIVEIVKITRQVQFSTGTWILICADYDKPYNSRSQYSWIPHTTPFTWVQEWISE